MKNQKRIFKIAGIVIAVIILFLVAGSFLFSYFAKHKIRQTKLGAYELQSEKIETSIFQRQITLIDTKLSAKNSESRIIIPKAKVSGIKLIHLLFNKKIAVNTFSVQGPAIYLYKNSNKSSDSTSTKSSSAISRTIKIKQLEISGVEFHLLKQQQNEVDTVFTTLFGLNISNLSTDSSNTDYRYSAPGFHFDKIEFIARQGEVKMGKGLYKFHFENLSFDSDYPNLVVAKSKFTSPYGKYEIGQHTGVETDWYNMKIDSIELSSIKLHSLLKDTIFMLNNINIGNIQADIFRDKRLQFPKKPDTKLPAELIQSIPMRFHCDSIILQNADIQFEEHGKNAEEAGRITFNNLHAKFTDIGNIDSLRKGPIKLSARAEVMNTATLTVDFLFTSPGAKEPSQVTGSLEPAKFAIFNPMLLPYLGVKVQSGQIDQLDFNFGYNNNRSNGDMIFEYKNLDFVMRNQENNSKKLVFTFLANSFVIEEQNLKGNSSYEKGEISFERDPKKAAFSYWWRSLLSGFKSIATTI